MGYVYKLPQRAPIVGHNVKCALSMLFDQCVVLSVHLVDQSLSNLFMLFEQYFVLSSQISRTMFDFYLPMLFEQFQVSWTIIVLNV